MCVRESVFGRGLERESEAENKREVRKERIDQSLK